VTKFFRWSVLLLLAGILTACTLEGSVSTEIIKLSSGEFLLKNQARPPQGKDLNWQAVQLPDLWDISHPQASGTGWYRFRLNLNSPPGQLWAIYLPRINRNIAVFINNQLIGQDAIFGDSGVNSWNHPQYFDISAGALHSGTNSVLLRLNSAQHSRGRLLPFYIGPDSALKSRYERTQFIRITLNQIVGVFSLTMGLCVGILWLVRREADYGWFALGSIFWAFYTLWYFVQKIPFDQGLWIALSNVCGIWMIGFMWIFVGTHTGFEMKVTRRMILLYCGSVTLILPLLPQTVLFDGLVVAYLLLFIPNGWMLWLFIRNWNQKPGKDNAIIFISILPIVLLGTHDWLNLAFHLQRNYLMQYSAPFIFLVMGWALLRRFTAAVNEVETLNLELEQRVSLREQELQKAFETIQALEKKKVLEHERERIMRDIHDGVGGQLVSALAILEHDRRQNPLLADTMNFALDDLRLIIDSLAPDDSGLADQLSMFKYRYEPKLKQYGINLHWQLSDSLSWPGCTPQKTLQLMRIIQEIFTNILKHASAGNIYFSMQNESAGYTSIKVCDDGVGFYDIENNRGRGMGNMRKRAAECAIEIDFFNRPEGGACVRIQLPSAIH